MQCSFAYTTNKEAIRIDSSSQLAVIFKSRSKLRDAYVQSISTQYLEPFALPFDEGDPEDKSFADTFNRSFSIWQAKPKYEEYVAKAQDKKVKLAPLMNQRIKNDYSIGEYIISISNWWSDGDIFFDILIRAEP